MAKTKADKKATQLENARKVIALHNAQKALERAKERGKDSRYIKLTEQVNEFRHFEWLYRHLRNQLVEARWELHYKHYDIAEKTLADALAKQEKYEEETEADS